MARAEPLGCPVVLHPVDHLGGKEQRSLGEWQRQGIAWLAEADINFRMPGLRVGKPGSQRKLDVVREQQEPGRLRWGQEQGCALRTGRCGGTNHTLGLGNIRALALGRGQRADERDGAEDGALVGRGPSCGVATASCLASGQPLQLGMVPSHQFVLLCCWRPPHVTQPWQRGRPPCPGLLSIPVFLEASFPAQHHLLSQGNMVMVGGAMLGTDHRLNLDGIYFLLKGPCVTAF